VTIDFSHCGGTTGHTFGRYAKRGASAEEVFTDANNGTSTCKDTQM
jgi:hypothetical protein